MNLLRRAPAISLPVAPAGDEVRAGYLRPSLWPRLGLALALLAAALLAGLALGPASIPADAVLRTVLARLTGLNVAGGVPRVWQEIVWEVRLPRVLLAGLVGATLAMAGATYQGVFRNPLADPYLIGVATGAALGATIVVVSSLSLAWHGLSLLPLAAFAGALLSVVVVYAVARVDNAAPTTTLILAGVAVASFSTALTSYLMLRSTTHMFTVFAVILGGLNTASWPKLAWAAPYALPAAVLIVAHGRVLNVLSLDEEQARHLGVDVERTKLLLLGAASLATAAAVSVSGTIGFVGLIVPHAVRLVWGADNRHLVPLAMITGAAFLILADLLARTADAPSEIPVGIITAFCGVPFFLYLLRRSKGGAW
ncbi:MAG TPA: iron ABC transporter permease [Dehalococcoidia bacterium]|nr:iron ABC transporter permease [Dehalococcoidia bacterium]